MKKRLAYVIVAGLMVGLLMAGCGGGKGTSSKLSAKEILAKSSQKMQHAKSFKSTGSAVTNAPGEKDGKTEVKIEAEIEVKDKNNYEGKMITKTLGTETTVYMKDGWAYTNVPGQGWSKTKIDQFTKSSQAMTPSQIAEFAKQAVNLDIVSEDSDSWKISYELSPEYLRKQILGEDASLSSSSPEQTKMIEEMLKGISMKMTQSISKSTFYVEKITMSMAMKNIPQVGDMSMDMKLSFSNYGTPVKVSVPAEALNAKEASIPSGTMSE
ncbi:MAG: hypothetical protein PHP64_08685 [Actinomycetota bacterium]|nr:hypothetical protein [Actinomycetota bacterium]